MAQTPGVPDIAQLVEQFNLLQLQTGSSQERIGREGAAYGTAADRANRAVMEEAALAGQEIMGKAQIELKKAGDNARSQAEMGANPDAQNYVLGTLSEMYVRGQEEVLRSGEKIRGKMQMGFSDNPLEWIVQQFTLPREVRAHNVKVQEQSVIDQTIKKIQDTSISAIAINAARTASTTEELAGIGARKALTIAEQLVEKNKQETARVNMSITSVQHSMDQNIYQAAATLSKAQSDLTQQEIALAHLEVSKAQLANADERLKIEKADEERRKVNWDRIQANEASMQKALDRATQVHGMLPMTVEQFKTMSGPMRDQLQRAMTDPNVEQGRLSSTPAMSLHAIEQMNSPLTPEQQHVKSQLSQIAIEVAENNRALWPTMKQIDRERLIDAEIKRKTNAELKSIPNEGSVFSPPPLSTVGKMDIVKTLPFWQQNFAKQAENEYVPTNAQSIVTAAIDSVLTGKMSLDEVAQQGSTIFDAIAGENRHKRAYNKFSMQLDPKYLNGYYTKVDTPGGTLFGSSQTVNLANAQEFKNHLMRSVSAVRAGQAMQIYESGGGRFTSPAPGNP